MSLLMQARMWPTLARTLDSSPPIFPTFRRMIRLRFLKETRKRNKLNKLKTDPINQKGTQKHENKKINKPVVEPSVGLLGLTSKRIVDLEILQHLVALHKIDLALKGGGPVLMQGQAIFGRLLEFGHDGIRAVDQELEQILSVDDLEMTAVWKRKRVRLQTTSIGYHK